jgi:hypothetical protein
LDRDDIFLGEVFDEVPLDLRAAEVERVRMGDKSSSD